MKQGRKPRHWLLEKSEQQQVRAYRWAKVVGVAGTLSTEQVPTSVRRLSHRAAGK